MIVRRRSLRAAEYDTVVAKLLRTASTGLASPRVVSIDTLGRALIVLERDSRSLSLSDSDPDWGDEIAADGERVGAMVWLAKMELKDTLRFLAPLSCCCCSPVNVVDTDVVDGREKVMPFEREELPDSLLSSGNGAAPLSGDSDTVAVVRAVVGLEGLMDGVNGVVSGRTVTMELAEILRLLSLSVEVEVEVVNDDVLLRVRSLSEGRVGREGATARGGSARWLGREA